MGVEQHDGQSDTNESLRERAIELYMKTDTEGTPRAQVEMLIAEEIARRMPINRILDEFVVPFIEKK